MKTCEISDKHIWFDSYLAFLPDLGDKAARAKADEVLAVVKERFPSVAEEAEEEEGEEMPKEKTGKMSMKGFED